MSTILIISPEPWEAHAVSKHHYARVLAEAGRRVLFLDPPVAGQTGIEILDTDTEGLSVIRAGRLAPGLRFWPAAARRRLERRWLEKLEQVAGTPIATIWLFENSRFFDLSFAGDRLKIYHQVDLNQDFHPQTAAATSDLAIAISGPIERRIRPFARNYLRLTHGVLEGHESALPDALLDQRFSAGTVHVALIGNLDIPYIDIELLSDLVRDHPQVRFHFVGGYRTAGRLHRVLGHAANVVWWGHQPAEAVPCILRRADLLLVTYMADTHREQLANPHKLMEYLASGTPVLASYTEEYANRPDLVTMADGLADFRRQFATLIATPEALADPVARIRRQAFAAENTYEKQVARIIGALDRIFSDRDSLRRVGSSALPTHRHQQRKPVRTTGLS